MIISHITVTVSDLEKSVIFYNKLFDKKPVALSIKFAYYDIDGLWFALNLEEIERIPNYNHIAFFTEDINAVKNKLDLNNIIYFHGRERISEEGDSIYLRDLDGNLIEFHNGTLETRLHAYSNRDDVEKNQ